MRHDLRVTGFTMLFLLSTLGVRLGQAEEQNQRQPANDKTPSPFFWGVDDLMERAVKQLTRGYNLDERQEEYTRKLMTQRVKRFLREHERDTRMLMAEFWDYQVGGKMPPAEAAKEFARRAGPLVAAIHKEIVDGNMKWREVLNEEQRKLHDKDLDAIDKQYQRLDGLMQRWSRGEVQPTDFGSTVSDQSRAVVNSEDTWEWYIRRFILDYRLDESQQQTAQSVLRQLRQEAASYREANKVELAQIEAGYGELMQAAPQTDPAELEKAKSKRMELDKKRQKLEQPIAVAMFSRLKQNLLAIPRGDQREAFDQREKHMTDVADSARAAYDARRSSTQPALDTQPASTQPATTAGAP